MIKETEARSVHYDLEDGSDRPYFPGLYGQPNCGACDRTDCHSRGKFQRNRRDFTYLSGRCPRLPDKWGRVETEPGTAPGRDLYGSIFPLVRAELKGEKLAMTLLLPGEMEPRPLKRPPLTLRKSVGQWYYIDESDGGRRRGVELESDYVEQELKQRMNYNQRHAMILRCRVEEWTWLPEEYGVQPRAKGRPRNQPAGLQA